MAPFRHNRTSRSALLFRPYSSALSKNVSIAKERKREKKKRHAHPRNNAPRRRSRERAGMSSRSTHGVRVARARVWTWKYLFDLFPKKILPSWITPRLHDPSVSLLRACLRLRARRSLLHRVYACTHGNWMQQGLLTIFTILQLRIKFEMTIFKHVRLFLSPSLFLASMLFSLQHPW